MALTPVEIKHVSLSRGLLGYRRSATDRLLDEIAASFEDVWRDRADLAEKVEQLEADLVRFRELEALLRATLVSAERTAAEMKEQARREADLIVTEAHAKAREVVHDAIAERDRLHADAHRIRALLTSALAALDPAAAEPTRAPEAEPRAA